MAPRGRRRSQQASLESSGAPSYEENLVERLARSLERSGFTGAPRWGPFMHTLEIVQ